MFESEILKLVERHVLKLFAVRNSNEDYYHNLNHTIEVVNFSDKLASEENLSEDNKEILLIAAWFHDTGHFHCCHGHEDQSVELLKDFLRKESYPQEKIETIAGCIKATQIPQNPKNKMEQIICDADLIHLGLPDLEERSISLRKELKAKGIILGDEIDWLKSSLRFITSHDYYTDYAKEFYGKQKKINQEKIEQKLKILESQAASNN